MLPLTIIIYLVYFSKHEKVQKFKSVFRKNVLLQSTETTNFEKCFFHFIMSMMIFGTIICFAVYVGVLKNPDLIPKEFKDKKIEFEYEGDSVRVVIKEKKE